MSAPLDSPRAVYEQALRWLTRRSYGERELARRLKGNGASTETTEQALNRCRELGYLDDAAFARSRARTRFGQGQGAVRVRGELLLLGIDAAIVQTVLEEEMAESDPVDQAEQVLEKRFGPVAGQGASLTFKERRQRHDFLARRGFDGDVIDAVLSGRR
ncbi:MAG: regulatory protein RecX [Magnetococcales bacterium]|nr:regulatory protein RecX [Magnetococcales bacterium]